MNSLDHWNFAVEFTGAQAACLIVGVDPKDPTAETYKAELVLPRLKAAYARAIEHTVDPSWQDVFFPALIYEQKDDSSGVKTSSGAVPPSPPALPKKLTGKQVIQLVKARAEANSGLPKVDGHWVHFGWPPISLDATALQSSAVVAVRSDIYPEDTSMGFIYEPTIEGLTPEDWLASEKSNFKNQTFSRQELHRWLQVVGFDSVYWFGSSPRDGTFAPLGETDWPPYETRYLAAQVAQQPAVLDGRRQ